MTVKHFNWHKSNGGIAMATTIDEIKSFMFRKSNDHRANGGLGKTCRKCSTSHPLRECPAWGKKCHKCGNKNHFCTSCRSKQKGPRDCKRPPHGRSTMRHPKGRARWSKLRSRSRSNSWSAHRYRVKLISTPSPAPWETLLKCPCRDYPMMSMGDTPFKTKRKVLNLPKRHFTLFTDPSQLSSISNEMDPDSKTKILTILNIKLPHQNGMDNLQVKVDNGAEANILPLDSFRTMFLHALDKHGYPTVGLLERSKINLECYNDGRLINHGCIKLKLQHYSEKSFKDHIFYVIETKTQKEIIIGHPVSVRLGLIRVLCKNVSKSISAIGNSENTSSSNSFQDHWLNIDGKPWKKKQRSKSESFQNHSSESFMNTAKYAQSETPFKTLTKTQVNVSFQMHPPKVARIEPNLTSFKTIG